MKPSHKVLRRVLIGSVAFTPKGGCPLKPLCINRLLRRARLEVAFTPKGGCPLKLVEIDDTDAQHDFPCSIHPQGWVPIETIAGAKTV